MKIEEFDEETRKLEKFYDKEIPEEQRKVWYEELKKIDIIRYKYIIGQIYRKNKYLPKLAEILEVNKTIGYTEQLKQKEEKIKCNYCNGTGFIFYKKKVGDIIYDYVCRCNCINGMNQNKEIKSINELGIGEIK